MTENNIPTAIVDGKEYDILALPRPEGGSTIYVDDPEFIKNALHPSAEYLEEQKAFWAKFERETAWMDNRITHTENGGISLEVDDIDPA